MARLGKFTGRIYEDNYDFSNCPECCIILPTDKENDEDYIANMRFNALKDCATCFGCPAARPI